MEHVFLLDLSYWFSKQKLPPTQQQTSLLGSAFSVFESFLSSNFYSSSFENSVFKSIVEEVKVDPFLTTYKDIAAELPSLKYFTSAYFSPGTRVKVLVPDPLGTDFDIFENLSSEGREIFDRFVNTTHFPILEFDPELLTNSIVHFNHLNFILWVIVYRALKTMRLQQDQVDPLLFEKTIDKIRVMVQDPELTLPEQFTQLEPFTWVDVTTAYIWTYKLLPLLENILCVKSSL